MPGCRCASGRSRSMYRPVSPLSFATSGDTFQLRIGTAQPRQATGAFPLDKSVQSFFEKGTAFLNTREQLCPVEKGFIQGYCSSHRVTPNVSAPIIVSLDANKDDPVGSAY
ncbi:hypothetical protein PROAA_380007 [Candidatus Propionivibrio aalborgensis]|uniref:Uncharacterized protein n=1 Tax=Candidatus Propionivibrio aalborgensis TaxID=1860101 RepID=A0A1A8XYU6_9RHOO|nr:hypothetical protein PROAA_380007 [Candidatus Propionivibrio aalborgensis]